MASSIARLFSSNLVRVRLVGSFSRFFKTKGFQYDQHDSDQDECILKCDDKHGSLVRDVINGAYLKFQHSISSCFLFCEEIRCNELIKFMFVHASKKKSVEIRYFCGVLVI